jgi:hypothetical protein
MKTKRKFPPRDPFEIAADLFDRYAIEPDFYSELVDHLHTGIVISRPDVFAMGKAVLLEDGRAAWFIAAAVGDLRLLLPLLPAHLPFIAFRRRGEARIRVYPLNRIQSLVQRWTLDVGRSTFLPAHKP